MHEFVNGEGVGYVVVRWGGRRLAQQWEYGENQRRASSLQINRAVSGYIAKDEHVCVTTYTTQQWLPW